MTIAGVVVLLAACGGSSSGELTDRVDSQPNSSATGDTGADDQGSAETSAVGVSEGLGPVDDNGLPTTDTGVEFVRDQFEGRSGESRLVEISFCGESSERPQEPGTFDTSEWSEYEPADGKFASVYRVEDTSAVVDAWRDAARNANDVGGCGTDWVVEETSSGLSVNDNWYVVTTDTAWVWVFTGDEPQNVLRLLNLD